MIERFAVVKAYELLKSYRAVSRELQWSDKTVKLVIERWKENPEVIRKPGSGGARKTTPQTDRRIIIAMKRDRGITSYQLRKELDLSHICERTIRRRITESGEFSSYWKTRTPFISKTNIKKRLLWCRARVGWSTDQWRKVLWSDESPFVLRYNKKTRVWRTANEKYAPWCTSASVKHDKKIMVWGCFAAHGVGNLYQVNGIMVKEQYQNILHTAKIIKAWFTEYEIPKLDWPAQSPDLNPIENLWSILDSRVKNRTCNSENELFQVLQTAWNELPVDLLTKLVDSMPHRCRAVIDANGNATKY
jgi:hypothetical protein